MKKYDLLDKRNRVGREIREATEALIDCTDMSKVQEIQSQIKDLREQSKKITEAIDNIPQVTAVAL